MFIIQRFQTHHLFLNFDLVKLMENAYHYIQENFLPELLMGLTKASAGAFPWDSVLLLWEITTLILFFLQPQE